MNVLNELTAQLTPGGNAAASRGRRIARRSAGLGVIALVIAQALAATPALARTTHALYEQDDVINFSGNFLAAQQASRNHDIEAAATYYRNALAADPQNPILIQSAFQLLLADGRIKDALPLAERILARDKNNHLARLTLGIEAFKRGNFERARANFTQMQPRGANMPPTILELTSAILSGWAYAGQNDPDTALKVIDRLKGPEGTDWYDVFKNYHTALIDEMAGRKADAAKRIAEAYKADSTGLRIVDADARNLARQGKKDEALAVLDAFDKQTPDHPLVKALRADIAAGVVPQPLIQSAQAGAAELLFGIGAAIGREGGEEIAAVYLQLALWLDPKSELALITLASVQGQLKQYDKAVSLLEQIPPNSRLKPMVDIQISRYYNVLEKYDKAKDRLTGLVKANPKDIDAVMALGDVYRATKDFGEAAKTYTQAIDALPKVTPADWSLFYYRGISYERTKQWPKAEADFFKAIDLNPKEPHVLNYLGYSWIDMGINLDKGLDLVKKAVALAPEDGYIVDSLGWAYYRLGRYEDAMRELERAIQLKPEDPVVNDHLGDAYWQVGRKLEATFQWAHARDMKPEPEDLAKILDKLKHGLRDEAGPKTAATKPAPATATDAQPDAPKTSPAPSADTPKPDEPKSVTPTTPAAPLPGTTPKPEVVVPGTEPKPAEPAKPAPTVAPAPDAPAKSTEPAPATPPPATTPAPATAPTDLAPPKPEVPAKPETAPAPSDSKPAPQLNQTPGPVPKVKSPIPEVTPGNTPTPTPAPAPEAAPAKP